MGHNESRASRCSSPFRVTAKQLLWFLAAATPLADQAAAATNWEPFQLPLVPVLPQEKPHSHRENFRLRHVLHHGTYRHPGLLRKLDVPPSAQVWLEDYNAGHVSLPDTGFSISSNPMHIQRLVDRSPSSMNKIMAQGRERGSPLDLPPSAWTVDEILGPNITDKETVVSFAKMASNAYVIEPVEGGWEDVGGGFNYTQDFGWESDGLRGHIFADTTNRTIVIGLKGTSPAVFDGADTTTNDKINDNLFFSCCCAQGGSVLWHQVCDCQTSTFTCNSTCLVKSLRQEDRYYYAAKQLYHNVTALYPDADVWITGHSLGGSVSSLLGITYGLPVVAFEAPGDAMAASRLGLPTPPGYRIGSDDPAMDASGVYHFGHTGDPVFTGNCLSCTIAGYAMESICHTGNVCRYDTVGDLGFHSYIGNHKIASVIHNVLEVYDEPAKCEVVKDCSDCFNWKYYKSNSSSTTTTSSSSSSTSSSYSPTRTETCKTPGWFGCLDETTTTSKTSKTAEPTTTETTSTSTCETPGWFGCLDPSTTTITCSSTTTTSTCTSPGWFGCKDPTSTTSSTTTTTSSSTTTTTSSTTTTTCHTPFLFWCMDETSTAGAIWTSMPTATPGSRVLSTTPSATATTSTTCDSWWPWSCESPNVERHQDSL